MKKTVDESVCVYGACLMTRHLQAVRAEIEGVQTGEDIEHIHRMRVASRRLRAAMPLFADCLPVKKGDKWLEEVREITRALGEARDADVQIERLVKFAGEVSEPVYRTGLRRLLLRLRQKRAGLQSGVSQALTRLLGDETLERLEAHLAPLAARDGQVYLYTPALYALGFNSIQRRLDDFLAYDEIVSQPDKVTELHAMRIAAKKLRYTLETFASLYPEELKGELNTLRKAQEALGDIHDCDVWEQYLPAFLEDEQKRAMDYFGSARVVKRLAAGVELFRANRRRAREKTYADYVEAWEKWKGQGVWEGLRRKIEQPALILRQPVYPPAPPPQGTGNGT